MAEEHVMRSISAAHVCTGNDEMLLANATAGAFAVTLPVANAVDGRIITVIKTDASVNAISFVAPAGYTIESNLADATVNRKDDQISLVLGGTVWYGASEAEALVKLQAATPGSAQTGHSNLSGTSIAGFFSGDGSALTAVDSSTVNGFALTQGAAVVDVVAAGVVTPADALYTQADQTANADAILEIKAQLNALLASLRTGQEIAP